MQSYTVKICGTNAERHKNQCFRIDSDRCEYCDLSYNEDGVSVKGKNGLFNK